MYLAILFKKLKFFTFYYLIDQGLVISHMEQTIEKPKTLEEAFSLLENGIPVEVETIDAVRIFQNTLDAAYKVCFNFPVSGKSIITPQKDLR